MLKGWKTFLLGALVVVVSPLLDYLDSFKETLQNCAISPAGEDICSLPWWVGTVLGFVIIGLRAITSTAIFKK